MQRYEKYKDSGIEWLGKIPEHWENRKLGNILRPYSIKNRADLPLLSITREKGVIQRGEDPEEDNHNFIPDDLSGYKHLKIGQFGMNKMKAWQGSYGYSHFEGIVSPAYYIFDISSKLFGEYFSKTIRSKAYIPFFAKASDGVRIGQWDLSKQRMKEIPFYVPPLNEQEAITKFLDDKCEKIEAAVSLKEQQIEKLKELRQITIHNAVTKGISHFKGEVVPTKDSGIDWIGEIPEHWDVKRLKHLSLKIGSGITPSGGATTYLDEGIPLLRSQNILFNKIDLSTVAFISPRVHDVMSNSKVKKYDVLLNITGGSIGRCNIVDFDLEMNVNQHVCIIRPVYINPFFLNKLIASEIGQLQIWYYQQGGGREGLNFQNLKNFLFPVPPISEQKEIVAYLEEQTSKIDKAIAQKQEQIVKLKEYKQSLINEVVTGKLKVVD